MADRRTLMSHDTELDMLLAYCGRRQPNKFLLCIFDGLYRICEYLCHYFFQIKLLTAIGLQ